MTAQGDDLRSIEFPDKDLPLRDDVRLLGAMVGDMVREQAGHARYEAVEAARIAAIARREGVETAGAELDRRLSGLDPAAASEMARAFSAYFQAVNLAERVHRIRRGRAYLNQGRAQDGSLAAVTAELAERGLDRTAAAELLAEILAIPVFTAHPTEATRRIILEKQRRIADRLIDRLNPARTPREERSLLARIRGEMTTAWQTEAYPGHRPRVRDEMEHVLFYLSDVLYETTPVLAEVLEEALREVYDGESATDEGATDGGAPAAGVPPAGVPPVRFASWVGGDMDGNPNVGAETILATLDRHREVVLGLYRRDLETLARHLSQSRRDVPISGRLIRLRDDYADRFPDAFAEISPRHRSMPYRVALHLIAARVAATGINDERGYDGPDALLADLRVVEESLLGGKGRHAGQYGVRRLSRRVSVFGFHLAALDIRQDGREHRDVMADLLGDAAWPERPPEERTARLRELLEGPAGDMPHDREGAPSQGTPSQRVQRTLDAFRAIGEGRRRFGREAIGPFIISMARDVDDVLTVLYLARCAGLHDENGAVPLDVVPLLETVPDLKDAGPVLERMLTDPVYAPHLHRRGDRQMVMVGYSDSSKDGGLFASRWSLHEAESALAGAAVDHDVALTIFHGRGGTVSRGGGKTENALRTAPRGSVNLRLRMTEQGEVIDNKYGLPSIALRELERMVGAVALHHTSEVEEVPAEWTAAARRIAVAGRAHYRALVYDEPEFYAFFREATPIDVIERMVIGSRPAARREGEGIEDLRAIPWVFSWTQNRILIPAWYGLGTGLEAAVAELGEVGAANMVRSWSFMQVLLDDVEMVLAKSDLDIGSRYVELAGAAGRRLFRGIREEFDRTTGLVLRLRGSEALLDDEPTLRRSIRLRNPYVDPLSYLQVDLLRRWRAEGQPENALYDALLETVQGVARGLKNTG